ncbi:MAG: hypothetical protein JO316_02225 [Abitibacteriaceae bacterium]|nr:hypothetical protein [Abditibacteriaceae bacterium]MBV9864145.1 hypothetical protein [Abditibacteriaceae bacterium]
MSTVDPAVQWGLPPGFQPVRYAVSDEVKEVVRSLLQPNEPVIVSIANEGNTISLVATPYRLFSIRSGGIVAGVTGANVREFPWAGITNMVLQQAALNVKIVLHFKSSNGRDVEVGQRARLAKAATDNLMPFESAAGAEAFQAIYNVWQHRIIA